MSSRGRAGSVRGGLEGGEGGEGERRRAAQQNEVPAMVYEDDDGDAQPETRLAAFGPSQSITLDLPLTYSSHYLYRLIFLYLFKY